MRAAEEGAAEAAEIRQNPFGLAVEPACYSEGNRKHGQVLSRRGK